MYNITVYSRSESPARGLYRDVTRERERGVNYIYTRRLSFIMRLIEMEIGGERACFISATSLMKRFPDDLRAYIFLFCLSLSLASELSIGLYFLLLLCNAGTPARFFLPTCICLRRAPRNLFRTTRERAGERASPSVLVRDYAADLQRFWFKSVCAAPRDTQYSFCCLGCVARRFSCDARKCLWSISAVCVYVIFV